MTLSRKDSGDWRLYGFSTRAVHAGQDPDSLTGSVSVPIYATSTYAQESPGVTKGFEYSRTDNPTRQALERSLASLENARFALAFSSGMAAISTMSNLLKSGDRILMCDDVYGGTYRLFTQVLNRFQIESDFVDATRLDMVETALKTKQYSFLLIESPTNPLMKIINIEECSKLAHSNGSRVIVDNTFNSPYLSNPLAMGADIIVHSTTKYLAGHSDIVGGALVTNQEAIYQNLKFLQNAIGAVPSPFDCWLVLRGIKTLALRMDRHFENAIAIAFFLHELEGKGNVNSVNYPGLPDSPFREIASRQMKNFGGMLSVVMRSKKEAISFVEHLRLFTIGESLGGVESLVELPALMTHSTIPEKERHTKGIADSLVRISVGIENKEDLVSDVAQALKVVE